MFLPRFTVGKALIALYNHSVKSLILLIRLREQNNANVSDSASFGDDYTSVRRGWPLSDRSYFVNQQL